jgi:hypothetical protein
MKVSSHFPVEIETPDRDTVFYNIYFGPCKTKDYSPYWIVVVWLDIYGRRNGALYHNHEPEDHTRQYLPPTENLLGFKESQV